MKLSISLENFKILNFFNLWALRVTEGKRPISANGRFSGTLPWRKTAPLKRPIKRSMSRAKYPPPYGRMPFRDSIAEGVSHAFCLLLIWSRASIAETPSYAGGIALQVRMLGDGYRTTLFLLRHTEPHSAGLSYRGIVEIVSW